MGKMYNERKFNIIYYVAITLLFVSGFAMLISSKGITVQGSNYPDGVTFSYNGVEYKAFICPPMDGPKDVMYIPDEKLYRLVEDRDFCEKYDLWNMRCDCYHKIEKTDGQVTFTMNWEGEPKEYTFGVYQYEDRDMSEVIMIVDNDEGCRGYGYSVEKLKQE